MVQSLILLASLLLPSVASSGSDMVETMSASDRQCLSMAVCGEEPAGGYVTGAAALPLCAILDDAPVCVRAAGRRPRSIDSGRTRTGIVKWAFAVFVCFVALCAAPPHKAVADPPEPPATAASADADQPAVDADSADSPNAVPVVRTATRRRRATANDRSDGNGSGNGYPRRPFLAAPNVVVTDPAEYPRPECLENDNPNSFWYSMRPNIFNVPVPAEWDFYNLINTDRPDFTDAVYSVGKGVTYLENGFTFHKINSSDEHISTRQLPESLLRHGITDEFEVRLKWPGYLMSRITDPHSGAQLNTFGSEDIDAGFKWEILQQQGWRPMTTLVAGMTLPTGAPGTSANFVQPHFNILAGWGFRRWLYLKTQTGCDYLHANSTQLVTPLEGSSNPTFVSVQAAQNSWHESISLLTQWTKRVGAYHEWFMISGTGGGDRSAQHYLNMGLYLYATPNIQFDVRIGRRLSNRVDDVFTGAGFSGRW